MNLNNLFNEEKVQSVAEGSAVFRGTGADGGKYEIIQSGDDFMIHANGKHIDSYGSLQRAMSVLKNEVPGLQQDMAEGSELKQAKRKYNQAAKDANADQVGAGKKIDTMKNSLRQRDVDNKKQGMAEDDDAVAAFMARGGEIQRLKSAKPRKGERWQGSAHIGAAGGRGTKGRVSGLGANTGKSVKPVVTAEDAAYDPFADDPAADAKHEADVFAKMKQQQQQGKGTKIKDMDPIDRDQYLKNTNRQWDDKTQRIVPATKPNVQEVSLGDYRKKAMMSKAMAQTDQFFDRDDPAKVAAADRTIAKRERGLGRADARVRPYTAPPVDQDKQRQQLTDKYPNIDQLVRRAEVNRDPNYEYADGQAYYDGQEAEQKYQQLKKIQRIIQGLNEELDQVTVNVPGSSFTADKSTNTLSGTTNVHGVNMNATKDMTPGGATTFSANMNVAPNLNLSATRKSADYNKGQLAGTKSISAKYTDATGALGQPGQQHTATRTTGVGFGGASGTKVGKNYVDQYDKTLADYIQEANPRRDPLDLPPLEGGLGGGGGGSTRSGPSPFGAKPGSREASVAQPTANTMTVKQGPNPDYVPPKTLPQKYDDLNKKLDQLTPPPPAKTPRPGRAAADQRQTNQAQAAELKDVVPLSPAERNQLRPVDANKVRQSELNKEPPDLSNVRPGLDFKDTSDLGSIRPGLDEESRKKREQPEEKYGPEYDDMVARVKKLAGLGPMKTVYDPARRVYKNVPTAQQPKK